MFLGLFILIVWFVCMITCYYIIRPIPNKLIRIVLTFILCILLSYVSCQNLPQFDSTLIVVFCWLTSLRLIYLTGFSEKTMLAFQSFLLKISWTLFPILPKESAKNQWPLIFESILVVIKILINHWIYEWSINCETRVSCGRIFMIYLLFMTILYIQDISMIFVRILTGDRYTLESFKNFPIFSLSLREFWGQRYNRIVNTILKESVFQPMQVEFSSSTVAELITFIISGLLHVHIVFVTFADTSSLLPTFMFFFLHGIACSLEANMKIEFPEHIRWLLTHIFLLITAPLMVRPFIQEGSPFLIQHPPPLINVEWIPKLPMPNFCLQ